MWIQMQTMMFVEYVVCLSLYVDQRHESQIKKVRYALCPTLFYTPLRKKKVFKNNIKKNFENGKLSPIKTSHSG